MTPLAALAIVAAGFGAGAVNTVVGSGSLITFPTLLALGYPPVLANVSNNVGLVPGGVSGTVAYRRELAGQGRRLSTLGPAAVLGGAAGAALLLGLPGGVFRTAVPVLIAVACGLMAIQPMLVRRMQQRGERHPHGGRSLVVGVFLTGVYGGYFGAAQGVVLIALLAIFIDDDLQRLNASKNALTMLVNLVAAVVFVVTTHVSWSAAGLIAAGSVAGGQVGARLGRRLPAPVLRWLIVVVGSAVAVVLAAEWW